MKLKNNNLLLIGLMAVGLFFAGTVTAARTAAAVNQRFAIVKSRDWNETAVRKVLQAFAYGGFASDRQITEWTKMGPYQAIQEMLTFDYVNERLSPVEDATVNHCNQLQALQNFWSSDAVDNPQRYDERELYGPLNRAQKLSTVNLQRTWIQAINARGCNPFLHKIAFYLTNYHAAISAHKVRAALMRDYYDRIVVALNQGSDLTETLYVAASSAAVARAYRHQFNYYNNRRDTFNGNDDFAREFFQLLFRIQGTSEDPEYHENVSIEHNAWLLTGMNLDAEQNAYGSVQPSDWFVAPIDFSDHIDGVGRNIRNMTLHYHSGDGTNSCLEILHASICGATAAEKLMQLAPIAAAHPESLDNIPVTIIDFYADDNLNERKKAALRSLWKRANYDILNFIRGYAISTAFHHPSTYKYRTAFDRNLTMLNSNVLSNEETYARRNWESARLPMQAQGAEVFQPAHDVFGGQTGLQAANNRYIFKNAFDITVKAPIYLGRFTQTYPVDDDPSHNVTWNKNWGAVIPTNDQGEHITAAVAEWLWQRFIADGGSNFDVVARAQIYSLLATGKDFGYLVDPSNPDIVYSSAQISQPPLDQIYLKLAQAAIDLSGYSGNARVGLAVNFIAMTPYMFALEGK